MRPMADDEQPQQQQQPQSRGAHAARSRGCGVPTFVLLLLATISMEVSTDDVTNPGHFLRLWQLPGYKTSSLMFRTET